MSLLPTTPSPTTTSVAASSPAIPRPAVILPGLGNNSGDYKGLTCTLSEGYGIPTVVARVSRFDWFRNAAGLLDGNYWKGTLKPRPVLDWYFERIEEAILEAKQLSKQGGSISLIGHSAGGWLARVYMEEFGPSGIALLLTLGSPHLAPPRGSPGVIDQTRGLLDYVEKNCAPAVYTPQLKYICIAGRYIRGAPLTGNSVNMDQEVAEITTNNENAKSLAVTPTIRARFVGQGYKQVCGQADVWGDGVVPEVSAHLEGALNLSLDGIYHSPVGSDDAKRPWYGSPAVVDNWVHHLLN